MAIVSHARLGERSMLYSTLLWGPCRSLMRDCFQWRGRPGYRRQQRLEVLAVGGGAVHRAEVAILRADYRAGGAVTPAGTGFIRDDRAAPLAFEAAIADLPARQGGQQVANTGKVDAGFPHQAQNHRDPWVIVFGEVAGAAGRFDGN